MNKMLMITLGLGVLNVAHAQTVIQMTAPAGTQLSGVVQTTTRTTNATVDVQPKPNVRLTSQALADFRKSFATLGSIPTVSQSIPATLEVLPTQADGGVPVRTTMDIPMPEGKNPVKFNVRSIYYPDGNVKMEFEPISDPALESAMSGLKDLFNDPQNQALYKKAWTPGEVYNQTVTLPFEQFTGGADLKMVGNFTMTSSLTYVQRGANDEYIFQVSGKSGLNEIRMVDAQGNIVMKLFMANVNVSGETRLRKDGLPLFQKTTQSMKMTLIMNMPELPVTVKTSMNMSMDQILNWQ
ncbi:hypothetical protein [Deinococcus misasensis]|uniref:hypothetical protein n=1 Tax=Deinococcus misasensis TaxID=392413 RepID=UPI0012FB313D|nr:hypothetical protein [Deinococcus misasensis]